MDEEIDEVITEDIEFPKIIVKGEGKIGEEPNGVFNILDQLSQPVECNRMEPNTEFVDDIRVIIKLEGNVEGVGVGDKGYSSHQANSHKMFESKRVRVRLWLSLSEDF